MTRSTKQILAASRSAGKVQAAASSVFHQPDPDALPAFGADLLNSPDALADLIAEETKTALAASLFSDEKSTNTGTAWFVSLERENLEVDGLGTRAEGAEYPMVRIKPGDLESVATDDIGGKFRVTDEAIQAGALNILADGVQLLSRALRDRLDDMTLTALETATESTSHGIVTVPNWQSVQLAGGTPTPAENTPLASLMRAKVALRRQGLAASADTLVLAPEDEATLRIAYGADLDTLLTGLGLRILVSDRMPIDRAYLLDGYQLGGVVSRNGLTVETWREAAIRSTWVQAFLEPAVYLARPGNVIALTGITTGTNPNQE